jgi:hypothetical protein
MLKLSRYRKLPQVVTADAKGRWLRSKALRPLPQVSGTFLHTVEEVDRLDHLAHKYYRHPRKWWRICDANPAFLSPQALLGKEPIATARLPLTWDDEEAGQPPWAEARRRLLDTVGVLDVQIVEDLQPPEKERRRRLPSGEAESPSLPPARKEPSPGSREREPDAREQFPGPVERAIIVIYNKMNVSAEELAYITAATGFAVGQPEHVGRVGKRIVIPPDGGG